MESRGRLVLVAGGLALLSASSGCSAGNIAKVGTGGTSGSSAGSGGTAAGGGPAGASGAAGTSGTGGASGTAGVTGAAGGNGSAGTSGTAGVSGTAGGSGTAGAAPTGPPKDVTVKSMDFAVDGKGTVFNVADDYFNDGFVPATPVANFGLHSQIITVANDDGSLDIAWLDYVNGKGAPWSVKSPSMINVTHIDAGLTTATTTATGVTSYKLLGFAKDASGAFYVGYNKDHALKSAAAGNQNNISGNELHVVKLSGGAPAWDKLIFGDQDNNLDATLGDPGGASTGILGFDPTNKKVVLYLGHSMMWTPTRHQAGFFRLLEPDTGAIVPPGGGDVIHFGAGWWYSHNFNQRLFIDGGNYYVLAHGDAFPRQLGLGKWSLKTYMAKNATDFNESYFAIAGNEGDNNTNAQTGQLVRLADGRFLMVHTTSQGRGARDVRLVFADGTTGKADLAGAVWLTTNQAGVNATMPKVELLGANVLVTYALWEKGHALTWYAALLDTKLAVVVPPKAVPGVEFVDAAPLFRFAAGPNAGRVGWVSGNPAHTLSVRVASATN